MTEDFSTRILRSHAREETHPNPFQGFLEARAAQLLIDPDLTPADKLRSLAQSYRIRRRAFKALVLSSQAFVAEHIAREKK